MKLTKAQLKEMVRKVIRKKLQEADLEERGTKAPKETEDDDNGRMSPAELSKHLEKEKERSKKVKASKQRQAMKRTSRGMELECGPGNKRRNDEEGEEDFLLRIEQFLLQSEKERLD